VLVLVLVLLGVIVFGIRQNLNQKADELDKAERSESIENPMNAAFGVPGSSSGVWKEVVDKTSGKTYYVNRQTKATTWERPAELSNSHGGGVGPMGTGGDGGSHPVWKEVVDKTSGKTYYVNRQTKATTWDRPAELGDGSSGGGSGGVGVGSSGNGGSHPVWKEVVDKTSGKTYYVNRQTKATTWDRPAELGDGGGSGAAPESIEV